MIAPIPNNAGSVLQAYSVSPANNRSTLIRLMNTASFDAERHAIQNVNEVCPLFEAPTPFPDNSPCLVHALNASTFSDIKEQLGNSFCKSLRPAEQEVLLQTLLSLVSI